MSTEESNLISRAVKDCGLPDYVIGAFERWVYHGILPGDFLTAILRNDFMEAVGRADFQNINLLPNYARFIYNDVPSGCHGSPQAVDAWAKRFKEVQS